LLVELRAALGGCGKDFVVGEVEVDAEGLAFPAHAGEVAAGFVHVVGDARKGAVALVAREFSAERGRHTIHH